MFRMQESYISAGKVYYAWKPCCYSLHCAIKCQSCSTTYLIPHPGHDLDLLVKQSFVCEGCGLEGSDFCYHCRTCVTNYHTLCNRMPLFVSCASHKYELKIQFAPPYGHDIGFRCYICKKTNSSRWLYRCDDCNFDVHLNCVFAAPTPQSPPEHEVIQSISAGVDPLRSDSRNSAGKLQSQNYQSLYEPVSLAMLGDAPFSWESRS